MYVTVHQNNTHQLEISVKYGKGKENRCGWWDFRIPVNFLSLKYTVLNYIKIKS